MQDPINLNKIYLYSFTNIPYLRHLAETLNLLFLLHKKRTVCGMPKNER